MGITRPTGYRFDASTRLTALARGLAGGRKHVLQGERVRVVARVATELLTRAEPDVFAELSHGQVHRDDLVVSARNGRPLVLQAAEFVDVAQSVSTSAATVPLPSWFDLRFELRFADDPEDPEQRWCYALAFTDNHRFEEAWQSYPGVESYPLVDAGEVNEDSDPESDERRLIWDRVLAPFGGSAALGLQVSPGDLVFDVAQSLSQPERDAERVEADQVTVPLVVDAVRSLLGERAPDDLHDLLTRRTEG